MIQIKMFPAKNGDSFLIKAGDLPNSHILIDGGFNDTYTKYIKPELENLAATNKSLGLIVISHIDEDHIKGIIKLIEDNGSNLDPSIIKIDNVWHNSLRSITTYVSNLDDLSIMDREIIKDLNTLEYPSSDGDCDISAKQGSSLARLLAENDYIWNFKQGYEPISKHSVSIYSLNSEIDIQILTPDEEILNLLKTKWEKELRYKGFTGNISNSVFDDGFEFLLARDQNIIDSESISDIQNLEKAYIPDNSITNRSSISFILKAKGKRILFLGDSWAEDIEESLKEIFGNQSKIMFDAIKISHHGSRSNTSVTLLEIIDAPIYFISTNGQKHGHPDMPVLLEIVKRETLVRRKIYFSEENVTMDNLKNLEDRFNFEILNASNNWINL